MTSLPYFEYLISFCLNYYKVPAVSVLRQMSFICHNFRVQKWSLVYVNIIYTLKLHRNTLVFCQYLLQYYILNVVSECQELLFFGPALRSIVAA